jgi:hypothetical protein
LTLRFSPMIGGVLYWLRPGTTRLPPWPERVPLTRGTRRTLFDVALYAGLIAAALNLLLSGGVDAGPPARRGASIPSPSVSSSPSSSSSACATRSPSSPPVRRSTGTWRSSFSSPLTNMIIAAQLVFVCIWWGAASSKLNRHFPFVVTVMISNTPWNRWRAAKRRLYRDHPEDLRPSSMGALTAHLGTVMEFTLPLILLVSQGGVIGTIAVAGMIVFHLHILSTFPLARAAGVEHLHDLRPALPLRPLWRYVVLDR